MIEPPVIFAIITALKIEREAVVSRLERREKIKFDDEPLTFYIGNVSVPGEASPFTVVVTQLLETGNNDAGITATRVIQRWCPRNVLMVGIAGGVKEKAKLGDVVVSQFAFYYEPAKLTADGIEHRGRQFNSDLILLARAPHDEAAEWIGEIGVPRPGDAADIELPKVHFGPIACGEEVVASFEALGEIQQQCPKTIAVATEGAGVAKAVLSDGTAPRYLEIRSISDDDAVPGKNDSWHEYAANAAAAFSIGFIRSRPFPPGPAPEQYTGPAKAVPTLVMAVQSLRQFSAEELMPALDEETKRGELEFLPLDLTDGYFTEEYGLNVMHDVRVLLDEEAIDRVSFIWTETGTNQVLDEFAYKVIIGGIGLADDRSGNIRYYLDLVSADFGVRVTYTDRWHGLPESQKDVIRDDLKLTWGRAGRLDYSSGSWQSDRTYSKDGYGLARERFVRPR